MFSLQVFVHDFFLDALGLLMNSESKIVKNFLLTTIKLQFMEKNIDGFKLANGVMSASFKVSHPKDKDSRNTCSRFWEDSNRKSCTGGFKVLVDNTTSSIH